MKFTISAATPDYAFREGGREYAFIEGVLSVDTEADVKRVVRYATEHPALEIADASGPVAEAPEPVRVSRPNGVIEAKPKGRPRSFKAKA